MLSRMRGVRALVHNKRTPIVSAFVVCTFCATWLSTWRPQAQNQIDRAPNAVRRLDPAAPRPRAAGSDHGATYYWLEQRAVRTTTRFADAVAVTERIAGGDLRTRLTDSAGRDVATLTLDRLAQTGDVIDFGADDNRLRAAGRPGAQPTLDWGNRQAYALWKDNAALHDASLEWRGDLIRARGGRPLDFQRDTTEVRTEWPEGFAAVATRTAGARRHPATGAPARGTMLESQLTRDNLEVGRSRWHPEEQVYVWSLPGLTRGYMDAERLKDSGGWTFTPDLAWTNVQNYAFHHLHTLIATQGFVARRGATPGRWVDRLMTLLAPTVYANEPGCDGLHWLDGSVFRPCCDTHDLCYEKYGCTWKSWWTWWSSWRCTGCNIAVVLCISSAYPPFSPSYP